jgi:hypothetical protein
MTQALFCVDPYCNNYFTTKDTLPTQDIISIYDLQYAYYSSSLKNLLLHYIIACQLKDEG